MLKIGSLVGGQSLVAVDSSANTCFFNFGNTDGVVLVTVFVLFSCLVFVVLVVVCSVTCLVGKFVLIFSCLCSEGIVLWLLFVFLTCVNGPASAGGALPVLLVMFRYKETGLLLLLPAAFR